MRGTRRVPNHYHLKQGYCITGQKRGGNNQGTWERWLFPSDWQLRLWGVCQSQQSFISQEERRPAIRMMDGCSWGLDERRTEIKLVMISCFLSQEKRQGGKAFGVLEVKLGFMRTSVLGRWLNKVMGNLLKKCQSATIRVNADGHFVKKKKKKRLLTLKWAK